MYGGCVLLDRGLLPLSNDPVFNNLAGYSPVLAGNIWPRDVFRPIARDRKKFDGL